MLMMMVMVKMRIMLMMTRIVMMMMIMAGQVGSWGSRGLKKQRVEVSPQ